MRKLGMIAVLLVISIIAAGSVATAGTYRTDYYTPQHNQRYTDQTVGAAIFGAVLGGLAATVLYESYRPQPVYYDRVNVRFKKRHMHRHRHHHDRRHHRHDRRGHRHDRGHDRGHGHR